jgi:hypothetical protein
MSKGLKAVGAFWLTVLAVIAIGAGLDYAISSHPGVVALCFVGVVIMSLSFFVYGAAED